MWAVRGPFSFLNKNRRTAVVSFIFPSERAAQKMSKTAGSSSGYRRLRAIFSTNLTSSSSAATVVANTKYGAAETRRLERMVSRFKTCCESPHFRNRIGLYKYAVDRLAAAKCYNLIEEILEDQKKYENIHGEGFNARLISLYGKAGMFDHAQKVFDEMPCKKAILSFNALLWACVKSGKYEKAEELFRELPEKLEIKPNVISYTSVIKALCEMGALDSAVLLLDEMEKKGQRPNLITFNIILNGLYGNGRFDEGEKFWSQMVEKKIVLDVRSYHAKLVGLVAEKRMVDAVELIEQMDNKGIKPDALFFDALIAGFINEENLEEAKRWYGEMGCRDLKPLKVTFAKLIPFVCGKGDLEFGFELSKDTFKNKRIVDEESLQSVVDGLIKESKVQEANELAELGKKNGYYMYKMKLPLDK